MKLKELEVKNLFGHFNHIISFHEEQITIITAPNGYGKTIVLKIIDAIFNKNFNFLSKLDFSCIKLTTTTGELLVEKNPENKESRELTFSLNRSRKGQYKYNPEELQKNIKRFPAHMIDVHLPFLTRIGSTEWVDDRTGDVLDMEYILENYPDIFPDRLKMESIPDQLKAFIDSLKAHFIQDQRLILRRVDARHSKKRRFLDTIEKYADELSGRIREASENSSNISQKLDTTFPVRLLNKDYSFQSHSIEELTNQLKKLQKKREVLASYNLLSSEEHLPGLYVFDQITDSDKKALTLYVNDTKQKLEQYDSLLQKIELFSSILNEKRLSFKKVTIDPKKGFAFETDKGHPLQLTQLSSGEQHQVVLLYELIFKTQENVLVLIDEPEISLHVAWQKSFLDELKKIIEMQNMVVVIATHSPQIIDTNWNLVVDLEKGAYA